MNKQLGFKLGFLLLFVTFSSVFVQAQGSMFVHNIDGKQQQLLLSDIDKLTFSGENMLVTSINNPLKNYAIPEIRFCNFRNTIDWSNLRYAIRVFPNPTFNEIYIESSIEINEIILYDIIGQKLLQVYPDSDIIQLQLNNYSSGVYVLEMKTPKGIISEKVIKE